MNAQGERFFVGRGKDHRKRKMKLKRTAKKKAGKIVRFVLANSSVKYKGFSNKYSYQSNMHNLIYKDAIIENVNFRGSSITDCNFRQASLKGVDFMHVNLKKTTFKDSRLKNVVFFGCNLKGTDFTGAMFENVHFINTNIEKCKHLILNDQTIVLNRYPDFELPIELEQTLLKLADLSYIYKFRTLHVSKNKINMWSVQILREKYSDTQLTRGLKALSNKKDKRYFYTLYSIRNHLNSYLKM